MKHDVVSLLRHPDGRWVRLELVNRRVDREDGVKGRGTSHVYTLYKGVQAARLGFSNIRQPLFKEGFRLRARLGKYVPVPVEQWTDTALARKPKPSVLAVAPRNALERCIARLERDPGVVLTYARGKPASAKAMAAAEKQLGRPLPPSLRKLLAEHDGVCVEWECGEEGWGVALEIWSLREMMKEWKARGAVLDTAAGRILPIRPTFSRPVLGVVLRERGEAKVVEWMDPPDGTPRLLAPDVGSYVARAVKDFFVEPNRIDVNQRWLPNIRRRFRAKKAG